MKKSILVILLLVSSLFAVGEKILTKKEITMIEKGILQDAVMVRDYDTISSMAYSFYSTALITGSKKLERRAEELLRICHMGNYISASLFLVKTNLKKKPVYARKTAKESIEINRGNDKMHTNTLYRSLVMLYVSSVLDQKADDKKEINFALEALQELEMEDSKTLFYSAFLFGALGMEDVANEYLNDACHSSRVGSMIYKFCESSEDVEMVDLLESNVIKKDCNKDIGKRCK